MKQCLIIFAWSKYPQSHNVIVSGLGYSKQTLHIVPISQTLLYRCKLFSFLPAYNSSVVKLFSGYSQQASGLMELRTPPSALMPFKRMCLSLVCFPLGGWWTSWSAVTRESTSATVPRSTRWTICSLEKSTCTSTLASEASQIRR